MGAPASRGSRAALALVRAQMTSIRVVEASSEARVARDWRDASVVILPLLPKTSFRAGRCLGQAHVERRTAALEAMVAPERL